MYLTRPHGRITLIIAYLFDPTQPNKIYFAFLFDRATDIFRFYSTGEAEDTARVEC